MLINSLVLLLVLASKNNELSIRNKIKQNRNDKTTRESNTISNTNEIIGKFASGIQYAS